jgi:hypothetical protein
MSLHILTVTTEPCVNEAGELRIHIMQHRDHYYAECTYEPGCLEEEQYGDKPLHWTAPLTSQLILQIHHDLGSARIPVMPVFYAGHDGAVHEVSLGDYMGAATYRWWGTPPHGWEILGRIHRRIVENIAIPCLQRRTATP